MARKKRESDQCVENRIGDPIPAPGIGSRITAAADLFTSRIDAASYCGISSDTLRRWERDETVPSFDGLARLAHGVNVSLDWLATGEGSMRPLASENRQAQDVQGIPQEIIRDVVEVVEQVMAERGLDLAPDKKAELVVLLCEEIAEDERAGVKPNRDRIVRLVKLAS